MNWHKDSFARKFTYVHRIKHRAVYWLTYYDWCPRWNEVYWIPTSFFSEFQILELGFRFLDFSKAEFIKKIWPESLESKTESEFRFQWGSQKSEPKIGIPNQDWKKNSCRLSSWCMPISQHGASNCNFTRWTTRHLTTSKHSFAKRTHAYSTLHLTSTAPIRRNGKFSLGRTTSSLASLGFLRPSQLQIGVVSPTKQTSPSTCYGYAVKILLCWHSRHLNGPTRLMHYRWLR